MQNVDSQKPVHTDDDNLDLAKGPISLDNIAAETLASASHAIAEEEGVQSDPETRLKNKARSRFTSAFRKLTRSSKKKEPSSPKLTHTATTAATSETVISSGDEHATADSSLPTLLEAKPKKKSKLARHFLLGSLKRSKLSTKKSIEENEDIGLVLKREENPQIEESQAAEISGSGAPPAKQDLQTKIKQDKLSPQQLERTRKVKITISSKKVEQTSTKKLSKPLTPKVTSIPSETDYLIPTADTPKKQETLTEVVAAPLKQHTSPIAASTTQPSKAAALTDPTKAKKKKLKTVKKATTTITTQTPLSSVTAAAAAQTITTPTDEKFVITQSTRDTPPRERAPAKPSRVAAAVTTVSSQIATSTGAIRKPNTRAAATLTSSLTTQQRSTSSGTGKLAFKRVRTVTTAFSPIDKGKNLMQGTQRGHRFPKPVTTTTTTATSTSTGGNVTPSITTTPATTPTETAPPPPASEHQQHIQFQSQSHESQSQLLPATSPEEEQLQVPAEISQSTNVSGDFLQPPSYPPPPIPKSNITTPENRSPAHRHSSLSITTTLLTASPAAELESLQLNADELVVTASSSGPDEVVSSAESVQPGEYYSAENNIENPNGVGYALSHRKIVEVPSVLSEDFYEARGVEQTSPSVRFAVGSAVRPQITTYESLPDQSSFDSNKSSDSASPLSESSRKRIRYVAQPTLFDDFDGVQRRREHLKYETGVSEYSVDSEYVDTENDSCDNQSMPAFGDLTMDQDMEPTIMTSANTEKREHLYKILVIGELGTGKTSFIKRYVHQFFSQNYRATIGVDFALKVLHWDANTIVRLQLWDIAGQERFGNMTRVYYKEAVGAFIVFDVTRSGTFDCVSKWKDDLDSKVQLPDGSPIPCILLANKCDQEKQGIVTSPEKMDEYVHENGFAGWFETSAKENINIDDAARALVNKILLNDKLISAADLADSERFNLNSTLGDEATSEPKTKCCR